MISTSISRHASFKLRQRAATNPIGSRRVSLGTTNERLISRACNIPSPSCSSRILDRRKQAAMSTLSRACPSSICDSGEGRRSVSFHAPRSSIGRRTVSTLKPRRASAFGLQVVAGLSGDAKSSELPTCTSHSSIPKPPTVSRTAGRSIKDPHAPKITNVMRTTMPAESSSTMDSALSFLATPGRTPTEADMIPLWRTESSLENHKLRVALPGYTQDMITIHARHGHTLSVMADMWHAEDNCHHHWNINFRPGDVNTNTIRADLASEGILTILAQRIVRD